MSSKKYTIILRLSQNFSFGKATLDLNEKPA
jgi:hypothetical protein